MTDEVTVTTIQELITVADEAYLSWRTKTRPWFRGEPREVPTSLIPKLYRSQADELQLLKTFRLKAPTYVDIQIPQKGHTDQWMFLAQHAGLPTRLLDWTEGLLIALHFALHSREPGAVVWMLNPHSLNALSDSTPRPDNDFPITWFAPELDLTQWLKSFLAPDDRARGTNKDYLAEAEAALKGKGLAYNIGNRNIRAAWEGNPALATDYPVAVHPTAIHPRITVQRSALTIWGRDTRGLADMIGESVLRRFVIEDGAIPSLTEELLTLGISWSTLFPDLDNLAKDLAALR